MRMYVWSYLFPWDSLCLQACRNENVAIVLDGVAGMFQATTERQEVAYLLKRKGRRIESGDRSISRFTWRVTSKLKHEQSLPGLAVFVSTQLNHATAIQSAHLLHPLIKVSCLLRCRQDTQIMLAAPIEEES